MMPVPGRRCQVMGILNVTPDSFSDGGPGRAGRWRAPSRHMSAYAVYRDVVADVTAELWRRVEVLTGAGIGAGQLILDPGLGFAKRPEHDWALLAHLGEICSLGFPVLAAAGGAYCVRVHEVRSSLAAVQVAADWAGAGRERAEAHAVPVGVPGA